MAEPSRYAAILARIRAALDAPGLGDAARFGRLTDAVVGGRIALLARNVLKRHGPDVQSGPFAGMTFHTRVSEGCYLPKLLGCYEQELHAPLGALAGRPIRRVVVVGCAEGYYAVGFARLLPEATVVAFDIDPTARRLCAELAAMNGVAARVRIAREATPDELADALTEEPALLVCDCEGCEYALLDPDRVPGLGRAGAIVELHGTIEDPTRADALLARFTASHDVKVIGHGARDPSAMPAIRAWKHLDQLLAVWEFRAGPTPWAVLAPRTARASAG